MSSRELSLARFATSNGVCGELAVKGESQPIRVTPHHRFWSVDQEDWVPVDALREGEILKIRDGTTAVVSFTMGKKAEPVYNLEVKGDHCYRVGQQGLLVHNTSANPNNPNIAVDSSATSSSTYKAIDCTNPNHFISGNLGGLGVLTFTVVAKTSGQPSAVSGQDFFAAMMAHFGLANVKKLIGHWAAGLDLDTNINQFNASTGQGLKDDDAASGTWTGQRAKDYGFTKAKVTSKLPQGDHPGQYTEVFAEFTK